MWREEAEGQGLPTVGGAAWHRCAGRACLTGDQPSGKWGPKPSVCFSGFWTEPTAPAGVRGSSWGAHLTPGVPSSNVAKGVSACSQRLWYWEGKEPSIARGMERRRLGKTWRMVLEHRCPQLNPHPWGSCSSAIPDTSETPRTEGSGLGRPGGVGMWKGNSGQIKVVLNKAKGTSAAVGPPCRSHQLCSLVFLHMPPLTLYCSYNPLFSILLSQLWTFIYITHPACSILLTPTPQWAAKIYSVFTAHLK